jgi:hypothetical protein
MLELIKAHKIKINLIKREEVAVALYQKVRKK